MSILFETPIFKLLKEEGERHPIIRIDSPDWVNVLAFNDRNEILFIKQFRHGTKQITLETPGGLIDEGDPAPLNAAKRELLEETGYSARKWEELGQVWANPAYQNNRCFYFVAREIRKIAEPDPDHDEEITDVFFIPQNRALEMLVRGEIAHSIVFANLATYFIKKNFKSMLS